jgi:hypothetical protein
MRVVEAGDPAAGGSLAAAAGAAKGRPRAAVPGQARPGAQRCAHLAAEGARKVDQHVWQALRALQQLQGKLGPLALLFGGSGGGLLGRSWDLLRAADTRGDRGGGRRGGCWWVIEYVCNESSRGSHGGKTAESCQQ